MSRDALLAPSTRAASEKIRKLRERAIQFGNQAIVRACDVAETSDDAAAHELVETYYKHWNV